MDKKERKRKADKKMTTALLTTLITSVTAIIVTTLPFILKNAESARETASPSVSTPTIPLVSLSATDTALASPTAADTPTSVPTVISTPLMGLYEVYLAIDPEGLVPSATFSADQRVYAVFKINDPTDMGRVKANWSVVDVSGIDEGSIVYTADYTILKSKGSISAGGNGVWKPGKYKVELYLNGQLSFTQEFQVTR